MVTNLSELIRDPMMGDSLGCSDHALVQFTVWREMGQSKVRTLSFRRAKYQFFKELVNRNPCEAALRNKGAEQNWQILRTHSIEHKS